MNNMVAVGVIPARYQSKRFEGKVLADISGKPMIQHVWERAKQALLLDDLIIACDDQRIKDVAREFGAKVVMTAKGHYSGTDRLVEVVNPLEVEIVVNIQADEPLIQPVMIDSIVDVLSADNSITMATLMRKIDNPSEVDNPNVVKVVTDKDNYALYFSRSPIPYRALDCEVSNPVYYKHIGIYGYTKDFLFTYKNIPVSQLESIEKLEQLRVLEDGFKIKVIETKFDTIGVDTPEDLEKLKEYLTLHNS
jgi:3-deoxy-manno-octulosonate cytidylyltransferase (CMP-KDO synthetase)